MNSGTVGRSSFESPATSPVSHVWRRVQRLYNLDLTPLEAVAFFSKAGMHFGEAYVNIEELCALHMRASV